MLPPLLILVAVSSAAALAFGTRPEWADVGGGLDVILWCRRLQWLWVGVSIAACVGLIGLSVASRRRALWLLGLAPVLALFAYRFGGDRAADVGVAEDPTFVAADKADFVGPDDWVVGLTLNDKAYAYPYAVLYAEPVVVQADRDKRIVLFWNAQANRVLALTAAADLRGRDLDLVSSPAGSLLVYNARHGQFVVGVTGLTPDRQKPTGLGAAIPTVKATFAKWRSANPAGLVMRASPRAAALKLAGPTKPMAPTSAATASLVGPSLVATTAAAAAAGTPSARTPSAPSASRDVTGAGVGPTPGRRVTLVGTARPTGVDVGSLSLKPTLLTADDRPAVLLRTDAAATAVRAFARTLDDMTLRFESRKDAKLPDVRMGDVETGSLWSSAGVAVGGTPQFRGRRLVPLAVDDDVDYAVIKRWVPDLEVYVEPPPAVAPPSKGAGKAAVAATRPARVRKVPKKAPAGTGVEDKRPSDKGPADVKPTGSKLVKSPSRQD
jgi:hypothetical protein